MQLDAGMSDSRDAFDWVPFFKEVLANENVAPLKVYNGLTPFLCFNLRPKRGGDHEPLSPSDIAEMYTFMAERQQERAVCTRQHPNAQTHRRHYSTSPCR